MRRRLGPAIGNKNIVYTDQFAIVKAVGLCKLLACVTRNKEILFSNSSTQCVKVTFPARLWATTVSNSIRRRYGRLVAGESASERKKERREWTLTYILSVDFLPRENKGICFFLFLLRSCYADSIRFVSSIGPIKTNSLFSCCREKASRVALQK